MDPRSVMSRSAVIFALLVSGAQAVWAGPITYLSASRGLDLELWAGGSPRPPAQSVEVTHLDPFSETLTDQTESCLDPGASIPACTDGPPVEQTVSGVVTHDSLLADNIILFSGSTTPNDTCSGFDCAESNVYGRSFLDVSFSLASAQNAELLVNGEDFLDSVVAQLLDGDGVSLIQCISRLCHGPDGYTEFGDVLELSLAAGEYRLLAESSMDWNHFSTEYSGGPLVLSLAVVPEPSAMLVFALGMGMLRTRVVPRRAH